MKKTDFNRNIKQAAVRWIIGQVHGATGTMDDIEDLEIEGVDSKIWEKTVDKILSEMATRYSVESKLYVTLEDCFDLEPIPGDEN